MNDTALHPLNIAAAALLLGGLVAIAMPQHVWSIARLVLVTIAAGACLYALAVNNPPAWWRSPFDRGAADSAGRAASDEIGWIRSAFGSRRQPLDGAPPLPPGTLRLLQPLIRAALENDGIDPSDRTALASVQPHVSPVTRVVLHAKPLHRPALLSTVRADARATAAVVQHVLDDLEQRRSPALPEFGNDPVNTRVS